MTPYAQAVDDWLGWWSRTKDTRNPAFVAIFFSLNIYLTI